MFWGLTPALDLLHELSENGNNKEEVNILIVGGNDCRHILQTLAKRHRHGKKKINFFIVEAIMENVAKQLLLLRTSLEPEDEMALVRRTRIFMELYGNTFLRPAVAKYLKGEASELVKMVTDLDYMKEVMPNVVLDLKFKDRDYMENVFKFWGSSDEFDIQNAWDRLVSVDNALRYVKLRKGRGLASSRVR